MITQGHANDIAIRAKQLCDELKAVHYKMERLVEFNSHMAIDWGAGKLVEAGDDDIMIAVEPATITVGEEEVPNPVAGNLIGQRFTPADVSNVLGNFSTLNNSINAGILGNINKLADV